MKDIAIITVVFVKVQTLHITYFESKKKKKKTRLGDVAFNL